MLSSPPPVGSVALHDSLRHYPYSSSRYRERFNQVAGALEIPLRWVDDQHSPNAIEAQELLLLDGGPERYDQAGTVPERLTPELEADVVKVLQEVESQRLAAVERSAMHHRRVPYRAPLEMLQPVERRAVELLEQQVKPALNRIEARQNDPRAQQQEEWILRHGDVYSQQLWSRFHRDQGAGPDNHDPALSLLPFFPDKPPINGMLDPSITLEEMQGLPADSPALRPTTALTRQPDGSLAATPLPSHQDFRRDHRELARALRNIALLEVEGQQLDPGLAQQLLAWSQFFRSGSVPDEAAAVQASIDAGESGGLLRVHLGPSESYWPDNTKFPYLLQVGIRDPQLSQQLQQWQEGFPLLEQSLEDIPHYQPRPLKGRGGFAEPIYQAVTGGFIETFYGREPRGSNFPNYSYGTEGSNRFINLEAMPPIVEHVGRVCQRLLGETPDPEQLLEQVVLFATGHESGHLIGPQRDHVTPSGLRMGTVLAQHWGSSDEPKADLTAFEMMAIGRRQGQISPQEFQALQKAGLSYILTLYPGRQALLEDRLQDHAYGYVLETGYFFASGALQLQDGRLRLDCERLESASGELWKKIIALQAAGDQAGFLELGRNCAQAIPPEADQLILSAQEGWREYFVERTLELGPRLLPAGPTSLPGN